jgi:hypothetical protein
MLEVAPTCLPGGLTAELQAESDIDDDGDDDADLLKACERAEEELLRIRNTQSAAVQWQVPAPPAEFGPPAGSGPIFIDCGHTDALGQLGAEFETEVEVLMDTEDAVEASVQAGPVGRGPFAKLPSMVRLRTDVILQPGSRYL